MMRTEKGHHRNDMELTTEDGSHVFRVFMRINERLPENFSIGLIYLPKDERGEIHLLRYNGPHGEFVRLGVAESHHVVHHVHRARKENLDAGKSAEKGAEPTEQFSDYNEALRIFLAEVGVTNAGEHFADLEPGLFGS